MALIAWLLCAILLGGCTHAVAAEPPSAQRQHPFIIFDGTAYAAKPSLKTDGVLPLYIAYEPNLFAERDRARRAKDAMPEDRLFEAQAANARKMGSRFMVIDIESWSVYRSDKYPREVADNVSRHERTVAQARRLAPDLQLGLFSPLPVSSGYERLIAPAGSALHAQMVGDNDNLTALAASVDAIFPIGYTFTEDRAEWRRSVATQVSEARRLRGDVPIYVFLWPQYADYGPVPKELRWRWIPADYWLFQLQSVHELADGVVIWGGWDGENRRARRWDSQAAWWLTTKRFIKEANLKVPSPPSSLRSQY